MADNKEITASISSMGYGHQVKVLINGVDIGVKGGLSESKMLFNTDHPMRAEATPEFQATLFVLKPGENTLHLEFKKTGGENDTLTFDMHTENQTDPLIHFSPTETSGTFEKTFILN